MKNRLIVALLIALSGCQTDPEHPAASAVIGSPAGPTVGTIDGASITEGEVEEFARTHPEATSTDLVARQRKANLALAGGADARFARKQAMVRALLEDAVEAKVPVSSVAKEDLDKLRTVVRDELVGFSGFEVYSVRVAAIELLKPGAEISAERRTQLGELVADTAEKLYAQVPEHDALESVAALDLSWVDPAIRVERLPSLKIADASELRELPRGWVRANVLGEDVAAVEQGDRTTLRVINNVPVFLVRKGRIDADEVPADQIEGLARARAVADERKEVFEELMTRLRSQTVVTMQPSLLKETE